MSSDAAAITSPPLPPRTAPTGRVRDGALDARPGSASARIGDRLSRLHPFVAFVIVLAAGAAALIGASILLGLVLTKVIVPIDGVDRVDSAVAEWVAGQRDTWIVDASWAGSTLAGGHVIPAVIGLVVLVCVVTRHWRVAAFVLFAVALESATYRVTTLVAPRERPDVERLEALPVNASYPSGHTAASIALFCGLALLASPHLPNRAARVAMWTIAIAIVPFVALSRVVRGMHHPLDVAGGVAIGIGALVVLLLATRAAGRVAERRSSDRGTAA